MSKTNPDAYDGSKYHFRGLFECDCGFTVRTGTPDEHGRYPGAEPMLQHLAAEHGWVRTPQKAAR